MTPSFLFLDLETTGLNPKTCRIIEIAAIITDDNFNPVDKFESLIYQNANVGWEEGALKMHKDSGLFESANKEGLLERDVEAKFAAFLSSKYLPKRKPFNLAGNSVHFDRGFLLSQMPSLEKYLTHRHLDVSSVRLLMQASGIKSFNDGRAAHRAMDDITNSINELLYYKKFLQVPTQAQTVSVGA